MNSDLTVIQKNAVGQTASQKTSLVVAVMHRVSMHMNLRNF